MKCQHQGKYCKGHIDGRVKYSGGKKVCSTCYYWISKENKEVKK
tara:strand:- start:82 stop:213 length:132 start_codon:yes stop_codon:yes gene_type:complete